MSENLIEMSNALAPFDHGAWEVRDLSGERYELGTNSLFSERAIWLVDKISTWLESNYHRDEINNLSVLEVGSYDGWVLTTLCEKFEFKSCLGIEPKIKNIRKGELGRKLSSRSTYANFVQGSLESIESILDGEKFDVIICLGMIHHVSSTVHAVKQLCRFSKGSILVNTMIIPNIDNDKASLDPYVNTKDVVYNGDKKDWSIAAFKYESPYGDGSTVEFGIVNIPSFDLVKMSFRVCGRDDLSILGTEEDYYPVDKQNLRGVKEILIVANYSSGNSDVNNIWLSKVLAVEHELLMSYFDLPSINIFVNIINLINDNSSSNFHEILLLCLSSSNEKDHLLYQLALSGPSNCPLNLFLMSFPELNEGHFRVISLIFRSPREKLLLECAKYYYFIGDYELSLSFLTRITNSPGCDWWSFYRACFFVVKIMTHTGNTELETKYFELLKLSNEYFPQELFSLIK